MIKTNQANTPNWKFINVKADIPKELSKLAELSRNIWWSWNSGATSLFKSLDPELWEEVAHNPVLLLEKMSYNRLQELSSDEEVQLKVDEVYAKFRSYMDVTPDQTKPSIAYFSMEYGLDTVLKIYSGGLGVLAGDYLKEASDNNINLCAVGFLYRYGYFTQSITMNGEQVANYEAQNFGSLPLERVFDEEGKPVIVEVPYLDYTVYAYLWRVNVGRIPLYLLDTDNELNSQFDKSITHQLYGGDWENRLKQEILLGIGGIITLEKLGIKKDVYHCNEGHAALINVKRISNYVEQGFSFDEALELVRASSLYTVHTPVPAGHDYFDENLFGKYMRGYAPKMQISWDQLMGLGRMNPEDKGERFCMSTFACNTCQEVNGVSKLHGAVSQSMFAGIWKGYFPEENHVGYVTNGVHFPTWCSSDWKRFYTNHFDKNFINDQSNATIWEEIYNVPDEEIWEMRKAMKRRLISYIKERFNSNWLKNQGDPSRVISIVEQINPDALLIGFGRRFATYKRAHLLFTDLERLNQIVNRANRPVQFLFTGKAHPYDGAGQDLIKNIVEISQRPEFLGKIIFLENYDMELARRLISGVDIWLNTPTRPLEASGTSGEKALMNGVLNFSVLDGWWYEGYREHAGWALTDKRTYQNQEYQDQLDAATIYSKFENKIIPLFYATNSKLYSRDGSGYIKNSIAQVAPHYTMKRMMDDYFDRFYFKLAERIKYLSADNFTKVRELVAWKQEVTNKWDGIKVLSCGSTDAFEQGNLKRGAEYVVRCVIDENGLDDAIGVDFIVLKSDNNGVDRINHLFELDMVSKDGNLHTFEKKISISNAGSFKFGYRMYPKHKDLPHRQDFCFVKWF